MHFWDINLTKTDLTVVICIEIRKKFEWDRTLGQNLLSQVKQSKFLTEHYLEFSKPVNVF